MSRDSRASGDELGAHEVRERAAGGAVLFAVRGTVVRLVGFVGSLVLARLLTPDDFGTVALGLTIVTLGALLSEGGMGATLVQRATAPSKVELESIFGLSVAIGAILALGAAALAGTLGEAAAVTSVMACSLPFLALRTATVIVLNRNLDYRPLVAVEVVEVAVYTAWGITTAALGWGVWALASAVVVRTVAGTVVLLRLRSVGVLRPRLSIPHLKPLLSFGAQFQAASAVHFVRDQGINIGTAAIGGLATLGIWTLAFRFMLIPYLLMESLWRVSFPAMSRLISLGEDPKPLIERGVALTAIGMGFLVVGLVGGGPGVVVGTVGEAWTDAADVLPPAALGLMVGGPVSVGAASYLLATGDARTVLYSAIIHTLLWFAIGFSLLPVIGVAALGIGWLFASVSEAVVLGWATWQRAGVAIVSGLLAPLALACLAAGIGLLAASGVGATLLGAALGIAAAESVYTAGLLLFSRRTFSDFRSTLWRSLRAAAPSPSSAA